MAEFQDQFIDTVLLPLALAAIIVLPWRRRVLAERPRLRMFVAAALVSLPMPIAFLLWLPRDQAMGVLRFAPADDWQAVGALSLAGLFAGFLTTSMLAKARWRRPAVAVAVGAATMLALWPVIHRDDWVRRITPGAVAAVLFWVLEPLGKRRPGTLAACLWLACAIAGSATMFIMGQRQVVAGIAPIGASLLVFAAVARWKQLDLTGAALASALPALSGVPCTAWLYESAIGASYPLGLVMLTACAPLAAWVAVIPWLDARRPWLRIAAPLLTVALVGGAAAGGMYELDGAAAGQDPFMDMYGP
ncbi:MAG: hypothetical protein Kow0022_00840 [Phycisphaerales bacterium]